MSKSDKPLELSFNTDPEHYSVLAVYGQALRNGFDHPEYTENHVDNFVGRDISGKMPILETMGYLERHLRKEEDEYLYIISDDENVKQDAQDIMKHIDREYGGRVYEFIEEFDESDREKLQEYGVNILEI